MLILQGLLESACWDAGNGALMGICKVISPLVWFVCYVSSVYLLQRVPTIYRKYAWHVHMVISCLCGMRIAEHKDGVRWFRLTTTLNVML
jgi:hypothetical protein